MKLTYRISFRLSLALLALLALWALFFYFILVEEINDGLDDALDDYSEQLVTRALGGEELPSADNGTNNTYYITPVSEEYAGVYGSMRFFDETVYIASRQGHEPARVLKTVFRDRDDRCFELTVAMPTFERDDLRATILGWIVLLYGMLLAGIVGVQFWVLSRSLRPLYTLLDWLDAFSVGHPSPPLRNETNLTEFRKLNEAALRSARRNEELYERQKQFIGNAAHELQTPLAVCRSRIEAMLDEDTLTEAQLGGLLKALESLDAIVRLNKTLLLLSRIDNGQFPDSLPVPVNELAQRLTGDFSQVYAHRSLAVEIAAEAPLHVEMNETLSAVLLSNLLKNAFVHTPSGGRIRIGIGPDSFSVRNTGGGGPLDESRIFDRFYRGEAREGSTGLGLALVRSVCTLYGLRIGYAFEGGEHIFTIFFPEKLLRPEISK